MNAYAEFLRGWGFNEAVINGIISDIQAESQYQAPKPKDEDWDRPSHGFPMDYAKQWEESLMSNRRLSTTQIAIFCLGAVSTYALAVAAIICK